MSQRSSTFLLWLPSLVNNVSLASLFNDQGSCAFCYPNLQLLQAEVFWWGSAWICGEFQHNSRFPILQNAAVRHTSQITRDGQGL